jgi:AcrR family transcriptional regulator
MPSLHETELDRGLRRDTILDAADRRFSHFGYARTTFDDIAAEADLPRSALTRHFRDKDDLFRAVSQRQHDQALATARSAMTASLPDALRAALRARVELEVPMAGAQSYSSEFLDPDGALSGEISRDFTREYLAVLADVFAAGDARGEIRLAERQFSAADAAQLAHCAARGIAANHVDRATTHRRVEQFVALLIAGLGSTGSGGAGSGGAGSGGAGSGSPARRAGQAAPSWADTSSV